jgi:transposase
MIAVSETEYKRKGAQLRALTEGELVALVTKLEYTVKNYAQTIEEFIKASQTGDCISCRAKDQALKQANERIDGYQRKLYGRSSERRGIRPKKNNDQASSNDQGGQKEKKERKRLLTEQFPNAKVEECEISDPAPPMCLDCKTEMVDSGLREVSEQLKILPMELWIVRNKRVRYKCRCCQDAPVTAALPARFAPGTSFSDSFLIEAAMAKFYDLIPSDRLAKMLSRAVGEDVSHNLVLDGQHYLSDAFVAIYVSLKVEVMESRVINADETRHQMLERNGGRSWYLWSFASKRAIYFEIHDTRAGSVSIEFMKQSNAVILMTDAYSGYDRTVNEVNEFRKELNQSRDESNKIPLLVSAKCNDHSRRYFIKAEEHEEAQKAIKEYGAIYTIESQVQEVFKNPQYPEAEKAKKALELRRSMDPHFEKIYNISVDILLDNDPKSALGGAANYFLNNMDGLRVFLENPDIPISNAIAERSLRNPVIGRKTWYGTRSERGIKTTVILFSIFESCRLNDLNPRTYFNAMSDRHKRGLPLLTPYQYAELMKKTQNQGDISPKPPPPDP